ncbi:major facilitator family putative sugar symporter [Alkalihalophilus pseudofirmus OF4]|uniref:Major facilitator family putative sugar symporter n=1 Tax=Alkalihalophilus pseudofirmus (strain ATCC BAA-2126 / JCM 17055 / OF4) TaxID=398511 RepID=D3FT01_ALKPO|nr:MULTISPECIES: MFS transporter [Alkalihalophilus]ADC51866.1 major facilitator family putative sugar symporter [Alkalihalophilus pseudofirmus OF4]MED1599701.1 MFS transporter [Alkalihalophilus marmarensis]
MEYRSVYRLMAYLFFAYSTMTIVMSYIPLYFQADGLSGNEVGILMAIGPFATIIAQPFWGFMSDKYKTIKRMIVISAIGVVIAAAGFMLMGQFYGYLIMMFVLFLFLSPLTALGDSLSQKTATLKGVSFGRIRMWGSLGFATTSLLTGYVLTTIGVERVMIPMIIMAVLALVMALTIEDVKGTNKPVTIISALKIGLNKKLMFFLLCVVFISITHRANDSYLGLYIVGLGGAESLIGWAWFVGVSAEALVFATSPLWFRKFNPLSFIVIAGFIYSIRWVLMGMITSPWMVLPLQLTHGISFGMFYIAAFQYVNKLIPEHLQATGHVLFITTFFGLSGIFGSLFGGWMIDGFGLKALYFCLGVSAIIGVAGLMIFNQKTKVNSSAA